MELDSLQKVNQGYFFIIRLQRKGGSQWPIPPDFFVQHANCGLYPFLKLVLNGSTLMWELMIIINLPSFRFIGKDQSFRKSQL